MAAATRSSREPWKGRRYGSTRAAVVGSRARSFPLDSQGLENRFLQARGRWSAKMYPPSYTCSHSSVRSCTTTRHIQGLELGCLHVLSVGKGAFMRQLPSASNCCPVGTGCGAATPHKPDSCTAVLSDQGILASTRYPGFAQAMHTEGPSCRSYATAIGCTRCSLCSGPEQKP